MMFIIFSMFFPDLSPRIFICAHHLVGTFCYFSFETELLASSKEAFGCVIVISGDGVCVVEGFQSPWIEILELTKLAA